MGYRKRDWLPNPTHEQLLEGMGIIVKGLKNDVFLWKLVGGFAVAQYDGVRHTRDLDFAILRPKSELNIKDYVMAACIPGLYVLEDGGFGLEITGGLLEVDFLDPSFLKSLSGIPGEVWAMEDVVLCAPWLLYTKLRTWFGRSQGRITPQNPEPGQKDRIDIQTLAIYLTENRTGTLTPQVLSAGHEYAMAFLKRHPQAKDTFATLGWFVVSH